MLDSPVPLYDTSSASLPTTILNDMKPGKEGKNVFFFLCCEQKEITHELRNWSQLNVRNRELQLSFSCRKSCQEGPKSPTPVRVSLTWGGSSSPSAAPHHGRCAPPLQRTKLWFLNVLFQASLELLTCFLSITGLKSHFCFLISCMAPKPRDTVWNTRL